jgi:hypothetical protein
MSGKRAKAIRRALKFNSQAHRDAVAFASDLHHKGQKAQAQEIVRHVVVNRRVYQRVKAAVKSVPAHLKQTVINAYADVTSKQPQAADPVVQVDPGPPEK